MRRLREILLTAGAVLGAACLLLGVVGVTAGVHVLVFRSGSMAPTIETGDLALTRTVEAGELRVDDVVSVLDASGTRVTHRVHNIAEQGTRRQLTMQGDANQQPDAEIYTVSEAQRVIFVVPRAGYLVAWSTGPAGLVLLGGYGAFLLSVLLRRGDRGDDDQPSAPRRRAPGKRHAARRRAPALLSVVVGGAMALLPAQAWAAPWTDPVAVGGSALTSSTIPVPANFACGGLGLFSVSFSWNSVAGATGYTLHYGAGGATTKNVTGTSTSITAAISGGTAWVVANRLFGSTTWTSMASNTRSYTVAVVSLCS